MRLCTFERSATNIFQFGYSTIMPGRDKRLFAHPGMDYFDESKFLDPSDWNCASYNAHPIDSIEPLPDHSSSYRDAALECMKILRSVDVFMSHRSAARLDCCFQRDWADINQQIDRSRDRPATWRVRASAASSYEQIHETSQPRSGRRAWSARIETARLPSKKTARPALPRKDRTGLFK
jgi:hypothetical protein